MNPVDIIVAALVVSVAVLFMWLARLSGRLDGLTSDVKRGPGVGTMLREALSPGARSQLHLPHDFESPIGSKDDGRDD